MKTILFRFTIVTLTILTFALVKQDDAIAISVTVSGAVAGNGSYVNLADAFAAINSGSQLGANILIKIVGDCIEPSTGAVLQSGEWTSVIIAAYGGFPRVVTGAISPGNSLIDLNGADWVMIDGVNSESGDALTLINPTVASDANTATVRFRNDASNNLIIKCKILGASTSNVGSNAGTILFGSGLITGNDNNQISFCDIGPVETDLHSKAVHFAGSTTNSVINNSSNTIYGCNIHDYFRSDNNSAGIYIENGSTETTIQRNKIYQIDERIFTENRLHTCITIDNNSGNSFRILDNVIGYSDTSETGIYEISGSSNSFRAINLKVGTTDTTRVQGNKISGIRHSTEGSGSNADSPCMLIYIDAGLVSTIFNHIGTGNGTDQIIYTSNSSSTSSVIGIANYGSSNFLCRDNYIGYVTANNTSTGASNIYGISVNTGTSTKFECINNVIGGSQDYSILSTTTSTESIVNGIKYSNTSSDIIANTVRNVAASGGTGVNPSASVIGIRIDGGSQTSHLISTNRIYSLSNLGTLSTSTICGIYSTLGSISTSITIQRNFIHSFSDSTSAHSLRGIILDRGMATVINNMVRLGITRHGYSVNAGASIIGINELNDPGAQNFLCFNSVYIGGNPTSGTTNTYAFLKDLHGGSSYQNNIFFNARDNININATGKHYAISIAVPGGITIGNNVYFADGSGGVMGLVNDIDKNNLSEWMSTVTTDSGSFENNPNFEDPTGNSVNVDLHIMPSLPSVIEGNGIDIASVTSDFDAQTRTGLTPVDIGADAGLFTSIKTFLNVKMLIEGFYSSSSNTQVSDTIQILLREFISPYNIIGDVKSIVSSAGSADCEFSFLPNSSYYIVLKHRNAIETWSATAVPMVQGDAITYYFYIARSEAFGNNQVSVDTSPIRFAIYSGDVNQDEVIDATDMSLIDNDAISFTTGYVVTDLNGDDFVDASDSIIAENNAYAFVAVIKP